MTWLKEKQAYSAAVTDAVEWNVAVLVVNSLQTQAGNVI